MGPGKPGPAKGTNPKNTTKFGLGNPGKPKGALNKNTKALKDIILQSLSKAGGSAYLAEQAKKNPAAYLALIGKVLPQDINASVTQKPYTPEQADAAVREALDAAK